MINKSTVKKMKILLVILLTVALASLIITSITPFFNIKEGIDETTAPADATAAPADPTAAPADPTAAPADPTAAPADPTASGATGFECINTSGGYQLNKNEKGCVKLLNPIMIDPTGPNDCSSLLSKYHNERVTVHAACNTAPNGEPCHQIYEKKQGTVGSLGSLVVNDDKTTLNFEYCPTAPTPGTYEKWSNCYTAPTATPGTGSAGPAPL